MLNLPIYLLGSSYYLHTRIAGRQVKKSLGTAYKRVAIIRAIALLHDLTMHKKDLPTKYELDLARGILKADGTEDHARLMQAIEAMKALHAGQTAPAPTQSHSAPPDDPTALKLGELLEKFFLLRKQLTQATAITYKNCIEEFAKFLKDPPITRVTKSDLTRFQEFLAEKGNSVRTIDNKISIVRALYNFATKQGYTRGDNPAADRALMTQKQRSRGGYAIFETDEIAQLLGSDFFKEQQSKDPDYATAVLLGLFTGCRIGEITNLKKEHFKKSPGGACYIAIRDSKTQAGIRSIPLHPFIVDHLTPILEAKADKLFKYVEKEGKGTGNAVGKKFARNLVSAGIKREKLVFHSLRKFVNNELLRNKVGLEARCQFIGHELDNVNVSVYTETITIDELAAIVFPTFATIAHLVQQSTDPMAAIEIGDLIDPDALM